MRLSIIVFLLLGLSGCANNKNGGDQRPPCDFQSMSFGVHIDCNKRIPVNG